MYRVKLLLLLIAVLLLGASAVYAHEGHVHVAIGGEHEDNSEESFSELEDRIGELEEKIARAQNRERTLASQIAFMENQIQLTDLRINETTEKIKELREEIAELGKKIEVLEASLDELSQLLLQRIVTTYKTRKLSFFSYLFSANSVGDFLRRGKYIATAQAHDKRVLFEVQETKVVYGEQKNLREDKKDQQEILQAQLETQQRQLDTQRAEKQNLLVQTQNDEAEFQRLLQQALAERQALEAALVEGVEVGPVSRGEPIALVGNTGYPSCSTGPHLHFEVRRDNNWVNPSDFLSGKTIQDDQNGGGDITLGSGSWDWPLEGSIRMTQNYGKTPFSWRYTYSGGIHTGLDLVSDTSAVIRAPADGTLFSSTQTCGSSAIKIKYIEHGDSVVSFYLHVQ